MSVRILKGDCREILRSLDAESVQTCITSPPYWGLRDYGIQPSVWGGDPACDHEWGEHIAVNATNHTTKARWNHTRNGWDELQPIEKRVSWLRTEVKQGQFCQLCGAWAGAFGLEPTYQLYVDHAVEVFREVWRVLRPDGTLWLNLGDSYATGAGKVGMSPGGGAQGERWKGHRGRHTAAQSGKARQRIEQMGPMTQPNRLPQEGLKPKDLVGMPWRVAFALQADGWWLRSEIIWCLSGGTRVYARTQKGEMPTTIKDLVRLDPANVQLWNGEKWTQVLGWSETPRPDRTYEIELRSGQRIGCTAGHLWPTQRGNVRANEIQVGDVIATCRLPEPAGARQPGMLPDFTTGWFAGLYLAEGSRAKDGRLIQIASHVDETMRFQQLRGIAKDYDGSFAVHPTGGNACTANIHSAVLGGVLDTYIAGTTAADKHLTTKCWRRSNAFLRALLEGYLEADGHFDAQNNRWRIGFCANDAWAEDLRTICARLGVCLRLRRCEHTFADRAYPGWKGEIRFERSGHWNCRADGEVVAIRESCARKFWDIGVTDKPHLFALASGVLTHNSKPNPMPESVRDRPTKAHEQVFLLAKSDRYFYDADAILEPVSYPNGSNSPESIASPYGQGFTRRATEHRATFRGGCYVNGQPGKSTETGNVYRETDGRNARSVWTIATTPFPEAHFATFPPDLAKRCILAGCPAGGVVLDPFLGAGTTALVADRLGRSCIGIELNPEYADMATRRIESDAGLFADVNHG